MARKKNIPTIQPKDLPKQYDSLNNAYQRLAADFDNYRKRVEREKSEAAHINNSDLIQKIFPILDNFRRSAEHAPKIAITDQGISPLSEAELRGIHSYFEGMRQIEKQFEQVLSEIGLIRIETIGRPFNHHTMEAVSYESHPELAPDTVIDEIEGGYKYGDKVVRPAKVRVSKGQ